MERINILLPNKSTQGRDLDLILSHSTHGRSGDGLQKRLSRQSNSASTTSTAEEQTQEVAAAIDAQMAASVTATANAFVSRVYSANIFSDLYVIQEAREQRNYSSSPRLRKSRHLTYCKDDRRINGRRNDSWDNASYSQTQKRPLSPTITREFMLRRPTPNAHQVAEQPQRASTDASGKVTAGQSCPTQQTRCRPSFEEVEMMDLSERRPSTESKLHKVSSRAA